MHKNISNVNVYICEQTYTCEHRVDPRKSMLNLSETRMKNQNSPYDRFFNSKMMAACVNA